MKKIIIAGGGTAGHINPAIAIATMIKDRIEDVDILYVGTEKGLESKIVPKAGFNFETIKVSGIQRKITGKNIVRNVKAVGNLVSANSKSKKIINEFKPDLVIGTGGYVSGPIVKKAESMGVKTLIHEQNAFPGVTTKILAKHADTVLLTTGEAKKYLDSKRDYVVTGLPVRKSFTAITKDEARAKLNIPKEDIVILSTGGSLGATRVNEAVADLMEWEKTCDKKITHIHSYGGMGKGTFLESLTEKGVDYASGDKIRANEYIDNMSDCMAAADIVISRAGAGAIAELQAIGRASILIPSPNVTGNHQYHNAMVLGKVGAAEVIEEKDLSKESIINAVKELIEDEGKISLYAKRANDMYEKNTNEIIWSEIKKLLQ